MTTNLAGASPVDQPVGQLDPERAAFEAWLNPGNHAGNVSPWVEPGRYEKDTHQMAWLGWWAADLRWRAALHAEVARLLSINSGLVDKSNAYVIENARQAEEVARLRADALDATIDAARAAPIAQAQPAQPLTEAQIKAEFDRIVVESVRWFTADEWFDHGVKAAERAHNISAAPAAPNGEG